MESLTLYVFLMAAEEAIEQNYALHEVVEAEVHCHISCIECTCLKACLYTCLQQAKTSVVMLASCCNICEKWCLADSASNHSNLPCGL